MEDEIDSPLAQSRDASFFKEKAQTLWFITMEVKLLDWLYILFLQQLDKIL